MAAVPGALSGGLSAADVVHDVPGGVDVGGGVAGPDAGDGLAGGLGQVGEPVGAGGGQLAGVGEQDADVTVGLVAAATGGAQGSQHRIIVLPGGGHRAQAADGGSHERGYLPVQSRHSPSDRGM
jgi:hypothetical protein